MQRRHCPLASGRGNTYELEDASRAAVLASLSDAGRRSCGGKMPGVRERTRARGDETPGEAMGCFDVNDDDADVRSRRRAVEADADDREGLLGMRVRVEMRRGESERSMNVDKVERTREATSWMDDCRRRHRQ